MKLLVLKLTVMNSVVASIECFMSCSRCSPWEFSLVVYFCSRDFITRDQLLLLYNRFCVVNTVYFVLLIPCIFSVPAFKKPKHFVGPTMNLRNFVAKKHPGDCTLVPKHVAVGT